MAILNEEGVDNLSIRKVAKRINVSHNAPYRSFENKEALLAQISATIIEELVEIINTHLALDLKDPEENFRKLFYSVYKYTQANRAKYKFISSNNLPAILQYPEVLQSVMFGFKLISNFIEEKTKAGDFNVSDPTRWTLFSISSVHGICSMATEQRFELFGDLGMNKKLQLDFTIEQLIKSLYL